VLHEGKNRENISLVLFFSTKSLLGVFEVWVCVFFLIKEIDNTIEDFIKEKGFIQEMDNIIVNFTIIYYCPAFKQYYFIKSLRKGELGQTRYKGIGDEGMCQSS
jgi:hypothetical protein